MDEQRVGLAAVYPWDMNFRYFDQILQFHIKGKLPEKNLNFIM